MFRFIKNSIMAKLIVQFLMVGLTPLLVLASITYYFSEAALEKQTFNHITSVNHIKKGQTLEFLKDRVKNLILLARSQHIRTMLTNKTYQEMSPLFDYYMKVFGYSDIILLNQNGQLLYTAAQNKEYDIEAETQIDTNAITVTIWEKVSETLEPFITDITNFKPKTPPALFMGAPVYADTGELFAVLIIQIDAARITALMSDYIGRGKSGETYLVGDDYLMRSNPRFLAGNSVLNKKIDSKAVQKAVKGLGGIQKVEDYRGVNVLSSYLPLDLKKKLGTDFDWIIITQKDEVEAFDLLNKFKIYSFWTVAISILLVFIVGFFQSKMIAKPINELSYRNLMVSDGDYTVQIPEPKKKRTDEIGLLIKSFNDGTKKIRKQMKMLMNSTNLLVSSITRISTTASQLASSASETSSSISEVTTTVEEVRQTSEVATEKAATIAQSADNTTKISYAGKQATENTMAGVNRIKHEMNYIAESTVKLSDQTKSIEQIINSVSDIADQSNILSVNAAIEAAKAGEHGKGFAVVAQEVKSLADQSKEATNQVRTILGDIEKATSAAVMATERGMKTVNEAVELSEQSGNAIDRLSSKVTEFSDAAMQITASNQQQLTGIDQLSQAMESINDATQQNLEGVKQLEDALKGLEDMVQTIKDITSSYKI